MDVEDHHSEELEPREPFAEDLVDLCRRLNDLGAAYVVVGGFAIRATGYDRRTMDVDLLIDTSPDNEARVFKALESLPDKAVRELDAGDVGRYTVVRVADEIIVDLMKSACGIDYAEASTDIEYRTVDGVRIPFASPRMLWRMKKPTNRAKDAPDLEFLRYWFEARGETPPECPPSAGR
jgi:predicted nucleotidyltransferase